MMFDIQKSLKKCAKYLAKTNGNSLMEFAVTTAMMAILAATAAPKLSILSENAKMAKSKDELDKLAGQALNFFQEVAVVEGRGRFPGQEKYNSPVTGSTLTNSSIQEHKNAIFEDLIISGGTFRSFNNQSDGSDWVSVFGKNNEDFPKPSTANLASDDGGNFIGKNEWMSLFGGEPIGSPFQDGHYVYQVIAGKGSGSKAESPILYIADLENPSQIHAVIQP
jgi:type II secretory pathway pseudopilin PulG